MFIIKFAFYFTISFIILCIPVKHATVFDYLHEIAAPYTSTLFESLKDKTDKGLKQGQQLSKKLFSNARPRQDAIHLKKSAIEKKRVPQENPEYTAEEEQLLKKVLENAY